MFKQFTTGLLLTTSPLVLADSSINFTDGTFMKIKDGVVAIGDAENVVQLKDGSDILTVVDYREKSYMLIEKESMQKSMNSFAQQMEAQLAKVPEDQREMVRQMMKERMPATDNTSERTVSVNRTGEKGEAAGFACSMSNMMIDGELKFKICTAPAKSVGMPEKDFESMLNAMDTMREFAESVSSTQKNSMGEMDLRKLGGVPVIFHDLANDDTNEVESISTEKLEPISVPEGFEKRRMEDMMRMR